MITFQSRFNIIINIKYFISTGDFKYHTGLCLQGGDFHGTAGFRDIFQACHNSSQAGTVNKIHLTHIKQKLIGLTEPLGYMTFQFRYIPGINSAFDMDNAYDAIFCELEIHINPPMKI